jgi:uncharacterized RDD family membrane protein YckC
MKNCRRLRVLAGLAFLLIFAMGDSVGAAQRDDLAPMPALNGTFPPGPFLVAADGDNFWLSRQIVIDGVAHSQMYVHPANQTFDGKPLWIAQRTGDMAFGLLGPVPQCLAVVTNEGGKSRWVGMDAIYLAHDSVAGEVYQTEMDGRTFLTRVGGQKPMAAIGDGSDLLVLALGPGKLDAVGTMPATVPSTAASAPATSAATAAAEPYWNLLAYHDGHWVQRDTLGAAADLDMTPGAGAVALVNHYDKVLAIWRDGEHRLVTRSIDGTRMDAAWSAPQRSLENIAVGNVQALTIGPRAFVVWPTLAAGNKVELAGGPLDGDGLLPAGRKLETMELPGADPAAIATGIAAGVTGNSILVVFADKSGGISSALFSAAGEALDGPSSVDPMVQSHRNNDAFPGLVMAVMVGLLALSLWQWQQKQQIPPTKTPARVARVSMRLAAALIDLAIPLIVVIGGYELLEVPGERLATLGSVWSEGVANWSNIFQSLEIMLIISLYLVHVTVGELFWGRSIGKSLCHLRVIAMDGSKPAALSILVRNVIRLFEMVSIILPIYMVFNPNRQRLGDLLARTMVIHEEPEDDKKPKTRRDA